MDLETIAHQSTPSPQKAMQQTTPLELLLTLSSLFGHFGLCFFSPEMRVTNWTQSSSGWITAARKLLPFVREDSDPLHYTGETDGFEQPACVQ